MQSGSTGQESRRENKGKGLSPLDKSILIQYSDMKEEIKDLRRRIQKLEGEINSLGIVSDSVKGTRKDGTIGSIKITGYPEPRYWRLKNILESRKKRLIEAEEKLQEMVGEVEKYIDSIESSELRMLFRLYYVDNLTWYQVAMRMNDMFPKRRIKYTEDNCKQKHKRFLDKVG